jgi:hypothetical protein
MAKRDWSGACLDEYCRPILRPRGRETAREAGKQLAILRRHGLIATWHDRRIGAGTEWAQQIAGELESADLILLLVSPDFLASDSPPYRLRL